MAMTEGKAVGGEKWRREEVEISEPKEAFHA